MTHHDTRPPSSLFTKPSSCITIDDWKLIRFYNEGSGPCLLFNLADEWNQSRPDPRPSEVDLGDGRMLVPCFD